MADYTENYGLIKPADNDNYSVQDQNDNMDAIDAALAALLNAISKHLESKSNPHTVTAEQIKAVPTSEKGTAGGVAELGEDGKVPESQLPAMDAEKIGIQDETASAIGLTGDATVDAALNAVITKLNSTSPDGSMVVEKITTSQNWTVPKAFGQKFKIFCVGGGGGGAHCASSANSGAGGGGGGYVVIKELELAANSIIEIVCGAGGVGGQYDANREGGDGGATSFGDYITAPGGKGGTALNGGDGGAGGGSGSKGKGGNGGTYGGGGGASYEGTSYGGNGGTYGGGGGASSAAYIGSGGEYGGDGGSAGTATIFTAKESLNKTMSETGTSTNIYSGGGGYGGNGGITSGGAYSGGGGGGYGGDGGDGVYHAGGGGGGGGYGGKGGNGGTYGGGGGGGLFCAGGNGNSTAISSGTSGGAGGGGGISDGRNGASMTSNGYYTGGYGGAGGCYILYYREDVY